MRKIDLEAERLYENKKVEEGNLRVQQSKYYWATSLSIDEFDTKTIAILRGRDILEIGCSHGDRSEIYAGHSKSFTGVDISDSGIAKAKTRAIPGAKFYQCDAHKLPFPDGSFDVVIVNSLLHHLDLQIALAEIKRVLRKGGFLCVREPLGTNPAFILYRKFTPAARTADERPFTFSDIKMMKEFFPSQDVNYFGFLSIFSAFCRLEIVRDLLTSVDNLLARTPVRYFFWQFYGFYRTE